MPIHFFEISLEFITGICAAKILFTDGHVIPPKNLLSKLQHVHKLFPSGKTYLYFIFFFFYTMCK